MMVADATTCVLEAMLRQESLYFTKNNTKNNNSSMSESHAHVTIMKQAVTALKSIHELCQIKDRETLVMATSYLHRYLLRHTTTPSSPCIFQVALVCFYMAVKIHQTIALPMKSLTDLYQRFFAVNDNDDNDDVVADGYSWEQVELHVCKTLEWRLHPPMPMAFASLMGLSRRQRKRVQACLEAAFIVNPCDFVGRYKASSLAQAASAVVAAGDDHDDDDEPRGPEQVRGCVTVDDDDDIESAIRFLQEGAGANAAAPQQQQKQKRPTLKTRKRAASPTTTTTTMSSYWTRPSKKQCRIGWTGSPRSALIVEDENNDDHEDEAF